ncbi:MAG: DUF2520 domain-containing protein [Muribaculaceae bacterium]|nr:DUF2520 domain-containing protein [Muribaculaceae bacterium]
MSSKRLNVAVIGTGNVGRQFARIFGTEPIPPRTLEGLTNNADVYIISVSDDAVKEVAERLPEVEGIVLHTTGSVSIETLSGLRCRGYGVMYPFQTISKARPLSPSSIPLLVEGNDDETLCRIKEIAGSYGFTSISEADSSKRKHVHLCGVFACNFTNVMIGISQKILSESGIDTSIINPLVGETIEKLRSLPAKAAQTGPASRKDMTTIYSHKHLLEELGMNKESDIYDIISDYIITESE